MRADGKGKVRKLAALGMMAILVATLFIMVGLPGAKGDEVPPGHEVTIMDQDYSLLGAIPSNIVLGNVHEYVTNASMSYSSSAGAIEYKTVGKQVGMMFVGIEPFINGNLTIRVKVNSDNWNSNVYIQGSTFWINTQSLEGGRARVTSLYRTSETALVGQSYIIPASALTNGITTINIAIDGKAKTLRVYHNDTLGVTTPMSDWSVQKLPYAPITQSIIRFENEKSSLATWVSTLLYSVKETVSGGVVSAIPGNDYMPFGIDYPRDNMNSLGTQEMAANGQKGVAWANLQWLEYQPRQKDYIQSLLDSGWELGIHINRSLNTLSLSQAQTYMQMQYDQLTQIFGRPPTSWCSYQNADNASHAKFAYEQLGMIWRNGHSGISYIPNVGNLQETRWPEFWSKISDAQMVYPSFTHITDVTPAEQYSISPQSFAIWVNNYDGKHIIGFYEYYHRVRNQIDTKINYLDYVQGQHLRFSVECNGFPTRLVIDFPAAENAAVLRNGVPLVEGSDYTVAGDRIILFGNHNDEIEVLVSSSTDFTYRLINGGTEVEITGYAGAGGVVAIPSEIDRKPVTRIADAAFYGNTAITSMSIPGSVVHIGDWAFYGTSAMTTLTLSEGLQSIGVASFTSSGLGSLAVPSTVTTIGAYAFSSCPLSTAELPDGLTSMGDHAFAYCSQLESITLPSSLAVLEDGMFWGCPALTTVELSDGLTSIGNGAFAHCSALSSITVPASVTVIEEYAFYGCSALTALTIPDGVTSIGTATFFGSGLESVIIPDTVTSIGEWSFYSCSALTEVTIPSSVTSIGTAAFTICTSLDNVVIPSSVTSVGDWAFYGCSALTTLELNDGLESIGSASFSSTGLTAVSIPGTVTNIGSYAFSSCPLTSAVLGEGVPLIGDHMFANCPSLVSVTVPSSVTTIEDGAFWGCSALTSAIMPEGLTSIGNGAFAYCSALASFEIPSTVTTIEEFAFYGCSVLDSIVIPDGVTSIGTATFYGCGFTSVTIPDTVTSIGDWSFYSCWALGSITIPSSVISIGEAAFASCAHMTSMTFEGDAPSVGASWIADHNAELVIYYPCGAAGYTNPWYGVPTVCTGAAVPSAPEDLDATAGEDQIVLTWSAPLDDGGSEITGYNIYRGTAADEESLLTTVGDALEYTDAAVDAGVTYYYTVAAVNAVGEGENSTEVSATLAEPETVPSAPQNLVATPGIAQIKLTWDAPLDDGGSEVIDYTVYRSETVDGPYEIVASDVAGLTYTDTRLNNGATWFYVVAARNDVGLGTSSAPASATTLAEVPSEPLDLVAVGEESSIVLSWTLPLNDGGNAVTGYNIYRGTAAGEEAFIAYVENGLTYTDIDVEVGVTYYYKVTAVNSAGEGAYSNEASAAPLAPPTVQSAPQNLQAAASSTSAVLTREAPS